MQSMWCQEKCIFHKQANTKAAETLKFNMKSTALDVCCKNPYQCYVPFSVLLYCLCVHISLCHYGEKTFSFPFTLTCFRLPFSTCLDFFKPFTDQHPSFPALAGNTATALKNWVAATDASSWHIQNAVHGLLVYFPLLNGFLFFLCLFFETHNFSKVQAKQSSCTRLTCLHNATLVRHAL